MIVDTNDLNRVYNAIIISIIIGIVLTIIVLVITFEKPEPFTEIYFEDSENLPEKIKLKQNYDFSFTVHSLENDTKTYDYETKVELYNLYDITEGTYKCLTKYRDKIRLQWVFGELIDNNTFSKIKDYLKDKEKSELIRNVYTKSVENLDLELIDWNTYNIEYSYKTTDGLGQINTVFIDQYGNNKYALIFSESTNDILFIIFKGDRIDIINKKFGFEPGRWYNVKITMKNNKLQLYINKNLVLTKKDIQTKNLKIGFETKNTYATIRLLKVYKEDFFLKDLSTIRAFDIDGGDMTKEHNKLVDKRIDYLNLRMIEGLDDYSKAVYNAVEFGDGIYNKSYEIKDYENKTAALIDWTNYDFEFNYRTIEGDGNIMAYFKDQGKLLYALIISEEKQERLFLTSTDKGLVVKRKKINISKEAHNVKITINKNKAKIYLDDNLIAGSKDLSPKHGKIGFALKNTNADLSDISVINNKINGSDPRVYEKYWKKYTIRNKPKVKTKSDVITVVSKEIKKEYKDTVYREERELIDEYDFVESDLLVDYDRIKELNESFNPYIKDTRIAFNGPRARIHNWTYYTFTFNYVALDGIKEIAASFQSFDGKDKYSIIIAEKINKTFFTYHDGNKELTKEVNITQDNWHSIRLDFKEKDALVFFDKRLLFNLTDVDFSNGQFVLETRNTYAHFRWVNAYNDKGERKRYKIEEDPCQLKKIGEQTISKKQIILNPDEKITKKESFSINKFFDYAKISAAIGNQEIHFWVTRG